MRCFILLNQSFFLWFFLTKTSFMKILRKNSILSDLCTFLAFVGMICYLFLNFIVLLYAKAKCYPSTFWLEWFLREAIFFNIKQKGAIIKRISNIFLARNLFIEIIMNAVQLANERRGLNAIHKMGEFKKIRLFINIVKKVKRKH